MTEAPVGVGSTGAMVDALLAWFDGRERDVPWRTERDPYRIWVAEVMAQQTRMGTVADYYARFIERFPTVEALADAPIDDVLKVWQGLGYYARARNLHSAARQIVDRHRGEVPASVAALRELSGVGPYTAGAVASMAFGIAEPAVDGNARRVLSRLFDIERPTAPALDEAARRLIEAGAERPAAVNQAIMDLGGAVCTPRNPLCDECPLQTDCRAHAAGTVAERPPRARRTPTPERHSTAFIIRSADGVLFVRRPAEGLLGGLWDLPGTAPAGEALSVGTAEDEVGSRYGVRPASRGIVTTVRHAFSHFRLELTVAGATVGRGEPAWEPGWVWAKRRDIGELAVPTYLRSVLPSISDGIS